MSLRQGHLISDGMPRWNRSISLRGVIRRPTPVHGHRTGSFHRVSDESQVCSTTHPNLELEAAVPRRICTAFEADSGLQGPPRAGMSGYCSLPFMVFANQARKMSHREAS